MRTIAIFALLLVVSMGAMTSTKFVECSKKISGCDETCHSEYAKICGTGTEIDNSSECKYVSENTDDKDKDKDWSSKLAENFHKCIDKCIDKTSGNAKKYAEGIKKCDASSLLFSVVVASAVLLSVL